MEFDFESERLGMRRWTHDDLEVLYDIWCDADVMRYIGKGTPNTKEQQQESMGRLCGPYPHNPDWGFWAVTDKSSGEVYGNVCLMQSLNLMKVKSR